MSRLSLYNDDFENQSDNLSEDIKLTKEKEETQSLTMGQKGILEIAELLKSRYSINNEHKMTPSISEASDTGK